jgi:hypothetical protein
MISSIIRVIWFLLRSRDHPALPSNQEGIHERYEADPRAPVATVARGQRVTITGNYNMPAAADDQMAIALLYIDQT